MPTVGVGEENREPERPATESTLPADPSGCTSATICQSTLRRARPIDEGVATQRRQGVVTTCGLDRLSENQGPPLPAKTKMSFVLVLDGCPKGERRASDEDAFIEAYNELLKPSGKHLHGKVALSANQGPELIPKAPSPSAKTKSPACNVASLQTSPPLKQKA